MLNEILQEPRKNEFIKISDKDMLRILFHAVEVGLQRTWVHPEGGWNPRKDPWNCWRRPGNSSQWAAVKGILGDYRNIPIIFFRVGQEKFVSLCLWLRQASSSATVLLLVPGGSVGHLPPSAFKAIYAYFFETRNAFSLRGWVYT